MHLQIGCRLELRCEHPTPVLALVHPHPSLLADVVGPERTVVEPDRSYEVLTDIGGNRWSRWRAPAGVSRFRFAATVMRPDSTDLVVPTLDTVRHEDVLFSWLSEGQTIVLCGPPGSGNF